MSERIKNILLLVKGSEEAFKGADVAIEIASALSARIIALNVIPPEVIRVMVKFLKKSESEAYVELSEDGWKYLYAIEERAKDNGVRIVLEQEEGHLERTVIDFARKYEVDMVVVGRETKKRTALQPPHKLLSMVLDYLSVPVLIV